MRKKITRFLFLCITAFLTLGIFANPVGWYDPQLVATGLREYSLAYDGSQNLYMVYSRLVNGYQEDKPQNFSIELKIFNTERTGLVVHTFSLPPLEVLFSVSPVVAVGKKSAMVVWQEPSAAGPGMALRYCLIDKTTLEISKPQQIDVRDYNIFQPAVFVDSKDNFHLFFQKNLPKSGAISLAHSLYKDGVFRDVDFVVSNVKSVGRGAFFPSILFRNGDIHIVYQSRQTDSFTDELYYIKSSNLGASFTPPLRITENNYNDFSPALFGVEGVGKNIELVWQANQGNRWQVYYSPDLKSTQLISSSLANSYQPTMGFSPATGKAIAWYDQRVDPGQVYARFLEMGGEMPLSQEHRVTLVKDGAMNPRFAQIGNSLGLFFISNNNLYLKKVDMETSPILISSPTHMRDVVSMLGNITLNWKIEDEPSGIAGYAYLLDNRSDSNPDFYNLGGDSGSLFKKGLQGGNYFFHLKYKDRAGNESRVYHYPFSIDAANPVMAEMSSPTHDENTPAKKHDFKINFTAVDDIGIKGYNYVLSPNRGAALKNFTDKNELVFSNLEDGDYYFLIQAVDKVGRTSAVASYRVMVVPEDYDDFRIFNNIADGRVETDFVEISIQMNVADKTLSAAFAALDRDPKNPFTAGGKLELTSAGGIYKARIPLPARKGGLYTLSLGLGYGDGTNSSIRKFHFEHYIPRAEKARVVIGKRGTIDIVKRYLDNPTLVEEIRPAIELIENRGLYKITFSLPENLKGMIQGYSYMVSAVPRLPEGEINYIEEPVFMYDLSDGIYYISVKPVYKDERINRLANYSYVRFEVHNKNFLQNYGLWALVLFFVLFIVVRLSRKLQFYLGKYT